MSEQHVCDGIRHLTLCGPVAALMKLVEEKTFLPVKQELSDLPVAEPICPSFLL